MKKLFFLIIIVGLGIFLYNPIKEKFFPHEERFIYQDILENIESSLKINEYYIYGKYLNINGTLPDNAGNMTLVLKNNEEEINLKTIIEDHTFKTNNYINEGINLEKLKVGEYLILLKDTINNKYYTLLNETAYATNDYYTMTKNQKNNHIHLAMQSFKESRYWQINIQEEKLPDNVYDVVIDPGHGGVDTGAGNGRYHESKYTLSYGKALAEALEEEGLKVKLTRDTDVKIDHYGEGSRTGIPYEVKAKLMLSIHLNSSNSSKQKGVEIYKAYYDNNTFAKTLASNIVQEVGTVYSNNPMNKVLDGVYMRVYSPNDIASLTKDAKRDGYEPYEFGNDVTYYYFVRETGGYMTKAFSDGRNPKYKANPYRNYNQGTEAYLCELAYISQKDDLNLVLNKKDDFIRALKISVLDYVNN